MEGQLKMRGQVAGLIMAVALSLVTTVIVGGMLYYTLKRYEVAQALRVEQVEQAGREQQAVTAGRLFAHTGSAVIRTDPAKVQLVLSYGFPSKYLLDAVVVNQDDVIVASTDQSRVGQRIQDPQLASQRTAKREVVASAVDAAGKRTLMVLEPLMDNDGIVAWAWFRFGWPADGSRLRSPADRMLECGRLLIPLFVLMLASLVWAMRSATSAIRTQLQELVTSLVTEPSSSDESVHVRKVN